MKNTFHRLIAGLIAASVLLCGCSSANMLTSAAAHELYDQRYSVGTASDEVNADFDDFTREIFTDAVMHRCTDPAFELKDPSPMTIDLIPLTLDVLICRIPSIHLSPTSVPMRSDRSFTILTMKNSQRNNSRLTIFSMNFWKQSKPMTAKPCFTIRNI